MLLSLLICSLACGALVAPLALPSAEVGSTPHVTAVKRNAVVDSSGHSIDFDPFADDSFVVGDTYTFDLWYPSGQYWSNSLQPELLEFNRDNIIGGVASISYGPGTSLPLDVTFFGDFIGVSFTYTPSVTTHIGSCSLKILVSDSVGMLIDPTVNGNAFALSDSSTAVVLSSYFDDGLRFNVLASTPETMVIPDAMTSNPVRIVQSIVEILVSGLTTFGTGLGTGISNFVQSLAFADGGLSVYFIMTIVFGGIALAVGLTTKIFNWLSNLGN